MNKTSTWYLAVVAVANILLAFQVSNVSRLFAAIHDDVTEGVPLLALAETLVVFHWWPWILVVLAIFGIVISMATHVKNQYLCHCALAMLLLDVAILTITVTFFVLSFMPRFKLGA